MNEYNLEKISDLLKRYIGIVPKDVSIKKLFIEEVKNVVGADINQEEVSISNQIIFLKTNSIIKNSVFLNKTILLEKIQKEFGEKVIKEIK